MNKKLKYIFKINTNESIKTIFYNKLFYLYQNLYKIRLK
jgi:hypothetical protein